MIIIDKRKEPSVKCARHGPKWTVQKGKYFLSAKRVVIYIQIWNGVKWSGVESSVFIWALSALGQYKTHSLDTFNLFIFAIYTYSQYFWAIQCLMTWITINIELHVIEFAWEGGLSNICFGFGCWFWFQARLNWASHFRFRNTNFGRKRLYKSAGTGGRTALYALYYLLRKTFHLGHFSYTTAWLLCIRFSHEQKKKFASA